MNRLRQRLRLKTMKTLFQIYYMFGFLFLVVLILIITCSETTVLLCYFHLAAEDYHWWWRRYKFISCHFLSSKKNWFSLILCIEFFFNDFQLFNVGIYRILLLCLRCSLLFVKIDIRRRRFWNSVFWIYIFDGYCCFPIYWNHWVHCLLLVRAQNLRCRQGRLRLRFKMLKQETINY